MVNKKNIKIGNFTMGKGNKILVQSMLNFPINELKSNIDQALELEKNGCDIIRVAIPSKNDAHIIYRLKEKLTKSAVVADIHFDAKIALECVDLGVDKIRINPGNTTNKKELNLIADACNKKDIPIRLGINSGSVKFFLKNAASKNNLKMEEILLNNTLENIKIFEDFGFSNLVVSVKTSSVRTTLKIYEELFNQITYPLHLGVTAAGPIEFALPKNIVLIGSLLIKGIGDTFRISITGDPLQEVINAHYLLKALELTSGPDIISCPTCARTTFDVIECCDKLKKILKNNKKNIKIAVMGCPVNGPGEAKEADIGVSGAGGKCIIFKKGTPVKSVDHSYVIGEILKEISLL